MRFDDTNPAKENAEFEEVQYGLITCCIAVVTLFSNCLLGTSFRLMFMANHKQQKVCFIADIKLPVLY